MSNTLTYSIELTPENASKIDQINKILLGESYTEEAPSKPTPKKTSAKKPEPAAEESEGLTLDDIRNAAKKAKSEFGEEFTMQVMKDAGVDVKSTLGRSMSAIPEEQYEEIMAAWAEGPQESEDEDLDDDLDDDLGDEEDEGEVDAEAVKTALKAYSKEHGRDEAKAIMTKHKVKALSGVDDLKAAALAKLMKELV